MTKAMRLASLLLGAVIMTAAVSTACADHEDHHFGPYKTKRSATCRQAGLQFRYCTGCDHWEKREIPKLPHTPDEWVVTVEPTCTKEGSKEAHCTVCGSRIRRTIDKLPHTYGELTVLTEPTCTANGKGQHTCEVCGKKASERIDKLGHNWGEVTVTKEPTCKSAGAGEATCLRCGKTQTSKIDKLEHQWGEWSVTKEPKGKTKGTKTSACTLCGETTTQRFYWEGTLYEDMAPCEEVIRLQEKLRDLGYYKGSIRSGTFGAITGKAVAKFQKDHQLEATAVADPQTLELLSSVWEAAAGQSASGAPGAAE